MLFSMRLGLFGLLFLIMGCANTKGKEASKLPVAPYTEIPVSRFFLLGEQPNQDTRLSGLNKGLTPLKSREINRSSTIELKLAEYPWLDSSLMLLHYKILKEKHKEQFNKIPTIIVLAEIKKKGKGSWQRVSLPGKYQMKVARQSENDSIEARRKEREAFQDAFQKERAQLKDQIRLLQNDNTIDSDQTQNQAEQKPDQDSPESNPSPPQPFYVADQSLDTNTYVRDGELIVVLFLNWDPLRHAYLEGRPLVTIEPENLLLIEPHINS